MNINKFCKLASEESQKNGLSPLFNKAQDAIINSGNAEYIFNFAFKVWLADRKKLQDAIIKTGNAHYMVEYYIKVSEDREKLEDAILKTGDAHGVWNLAHTVNGFNRIEFQDAIIKTGNVESIYNFARWKDCTDIERLQDAIIKIGNAEYIYKFADNIIGADRAKLQDAIIKSENAKYIYEFANTFLIDRTPRSGYGCYAFKEDTFRDKKAADIEKIQDAIIKSGNAKYICKFAYTFYGKGANIEKLRDAIIKTGNAEYINYFAKKVRCDEKIQDAIKALEPSLNEMVEELNC